jgi:hypothetical protein
MVFLGCDLRRRWFAATIDDAYVFHFAGGPPNKACLADLKPSALSASPLTTTSHKILGPRLLLLLLEVLIGGITQSLVDFGLLERNTDAGGVCILKDFARSLGQWPFRFLWDPILLQRRRVQLRRLAPKRATRATLRGHIVNYALIVETFVRRLPG